MKATTAILTALFLASCAGLFAAQAQLIVGDPAPPMRVGQWITGPPEAKLKPGRVYVLEFWATWCAPCIAAMPHLAQLQAKHEKEGFTVIAVAVRDDAKAVNEFVAKRKAAWNHPVAMDVTEGDASGFMAKNWLERAGREGIPWTFLVDREGRIAWIGHPMRVDGPLAALLAGTFNPSKQQQVDASFAELDVKLGEALRSGHWQDVLSVLDEMIRADPASAPLNYHTKVKALLRLGQNEAAVQFARDAAQDAPASVLAGIASELLNAPHGQDIAYDLAIRLCEQALASGESQNPVALSALARCYEGMAKPEDAARIWQQMLALDDPSIDKESVRKRLETLTKQQ
jgi:thiol-disulfide isomerase/thioredoxin